MLSPMAPLRARLLSVEKGGTDVRKKRLTKIPRHFHFEESISMNTGCIFITNNHHVFPSSVHRRGPEVMINSGTMSIPKCSGYGP